MKKRSLINLELMHQDEHGVDMINSDDNLDYDEGEDNNNK